MAERLLMIGVGRAGMRYVEAANRLGHDVHVVELAERRAGYDPHCAGFTEAPGLLDEQWVEGALRAWHTHGPFDAVLGFNDPQAMAAALVAERYGLPGAGLEATATSRNKGLQRAVLAAQGEVAQPAFVVTEDPAVVAAWTLEHGSLVVKPLDRFGSAGVVQVTSAEQADAAVQGRVVAEQQITGMTEYSWEAVLVDGEAVCDNVTRKRTTGAPQFVEVAHVVGPELDPVVAAHIRRTCRLAAKTFGVRTSIVHVELFASADEAVFVEFATRAPGDAIMEMLQLAYGYDWHEVAIEAAFGRRHPAGAATPRAAAGSYLAPTPGGRVVAVDGVEEARAHSGVVFLDVHTMVGDVLPPTTWSLERTLTAVVRGNDIADVEETISWLERTVVVRTDTSHDRWAGPPTAPPPKSSGLGQVRRTGRSR